MLPWEDCRKVQQKADHFLIKMKFLLLEMLKEIANPICSGLEKTNREEPFPKRSLRNETGQDIMHNHLVYLYFKVRSLLI